MKVPFGSAALRLGIPGLVSCSSDVRASWIAKPTTDIGGHKKPSDRSRGRDPSRRVAEVRTGIGFKHLARVL